MPESFFREHPCYGCGREDVSIDIYGECRSCSGAACDTPIPRFQYSAETVICLGCNRKFDKEDTFRGYCEPCEEYLEPFLEEYEELNRKRKALRAEF